jgi:hypothetical protein
MLMPAMVSVTIAASMSAMHSVSVSSPAVMRRSRRPWRWGGGARGGVPPAGLWVGGDTLTARWGATLP